MVLPLDAFAQEPQMLFGAADVIFGRAASNPIVVRVADRAVAHQRRRRS